jgi:hypothetical protein
MNYCFLVIWKSVMMTTETDLLGIIIRPAVLNKYYRHFFIRKL